MRTFRSKNPGSKKGIIMRVDYFGKKKSVSDDSSSYAGSVRDGFVPKVVRNNDNEEDQSDADSLHPKATAGLGDANTANIAVTNTFGGILPPFARPIYTNARGGCSNFAPFVGNSGTNTLPFNQMSQFPRPHIMPMMANVSQPVVVTTSGDVNFTPESTPRSAISSFGGPARYDMSSMVEAAKSSKRRSSSGMKFFVKLILYS